MNAGRRRLGQSAGFTLIELSVVLIIVGIITGMAMQSGVSVLATARLSATTQKMAAIEQALMAFRNANNRLPCPGSFSILAGATNYGVEAGGGMSCGTGTGVGSGACTGTLPVAVGTCAAGTTIVPYASYSAAGVTNTGNTGAEGTVPVATLGLPNDFMFDGWGDKFRYAVDVGATASNYFSDMEMGCTAGAITITDSSGDTSATASPPARSTGALYALISHGPNGHGAYANSTSMKNAGSSNANELTNCHCTTTASAGTYAPTYVQADPTDSTSGNASTTFDDLVSFKERWQLQNGTDPTGSSCLRQGLIAEPDWGASRVQMFDGSGNYLFAMGAGYNGVSGSQGQSGSGNGQFGNAAFVAIDSSGNFWVSDSTYFRIQKFSPSGSWLGSLGGGSGGGAVGACSTPPCAELCTTGTCPAPTSGGNSPGLLGSTYDTIAFDSSGNIWVGDSATDRIVEFNKSGSYLQQISLAWGSGNGQVTGTDALAIDKNNNLWIGDAYNYRIQELSSSGSWVKTLGGGPSCSSCTSTTSCTCSQGSTPGYFNNPIGLAFDSSGNLWVADGLNGNSGDPVQTEYVQEFNATTGAYMQRFGSHGSSGPTQFNNINGIAVDSSGNIWVSDGWNNRFARFTSSGSFLFQFPCSSGVCGSSTTNGQFDAPGSPAISR